MRSQMSVRLDGVWVHPLLSSCFDVCFDLPLGFPLASEDVGAGEEDRRDVRVRGFEGDSVGGGGGKLEG